MITNLGEGAVRAELVEDIGVEEAHVSGHLLHSSRLPLFLSVCELYHYAGRGTLKNVNQRDAEMLLSTFR